MKYGEKIKDKIYSYTLKTFVKYSFYYRIDPVPKTGHATNGKYYRLPKTKQEKTLNNDPTIKKFIRAKRLAKNLPDAYSDLQFSNSRNIS